jgi:metallo-beta-lactamase class B
MLKTITAGIGLCALVASAVLAQNGAQNAGQGTPDNGRVAPGTVAAGVRVDPNTPTEEQWNKPEAQAYVAKAKALAGNDPDLQYDFTFNCTPGGTHIAGGGGARMTVGDGAYLAGSPIPFVEMPEKTTMLPAQRFFDNFWRMGGTGVGAWLITTPKGYILFDTLDNAKEAKENIVDEMVKNHLDPKKIKVIIFGHWHGDHTGGGHYMQQLTGAPVYMGRDDWDLYYKMMKEQTGSGSRLDDKVPMTRGKDAEDGMKISVGGTTVTLISMPGHTPGSTGMIVPITYQGKPHKILVVTASAGGNNVRNRESFIGGFEHIWNWGIREKVESVVNVHVNYNNNTLSRQAYVAAHYPPAKNPMLYGVEKTHKYIDITRYCAAARLEALGW